jgi:hypothetical protein
MSDSFSRDDFPIPDARDGFVHVLSVVPEKHRGRLMAVADALLVLFPWAGHLPRTQLLVEAMDFDSASRAGAAAGSFNELARTIEELRVTAYAYQGTNEDANPDAPDLQYPRPIEIVENSGTWTARIDALGILVDASSRDGAIEMAAEAIMQIVGREDPMCSMYRSRRDSREQLVLLFSDLSEATVVGLLKDMAAPEFPDAW